ncbi:MAG: glycosyltransferase family 4 protein [Bryobacteraceae bacterium]|nr:glycosyltransferase family 4 protein [Bryobacteraceae bacterium]
MTASLPRRLIAYTHGWDHPACRFRIRQYIPLLEKAGWTVSVRPQRPEQPRLSPFRTPLARTLHQRLRLALRRLLRDWDIAAARRYDAVFLNRDLLGGNIRLEKRLMEINSRVIFDFDDAIFLGRREAHVAEVCRRAAWVTVGNEYLASFARRHSERVTVLPTVVDVNSYEMSAPGGRRDAPARVGWLGSDRSIRETLFPYLGMLARLQAELGFDFVIVSAPRPHLPEPGLRWRFVEWNPTLETQAARLFDIGVMPLVDNEFQRGKCGCKILQYMAAGLPVVASPVGLNAELIGRDERGFLADSLEAWKAAIGALSRDEALRRRIGAAGRAFVERRYSLRAWFPTLLDALERVVNA